MPAMFKRGVLVLVAAGVAAIVAVPGGKAALACSGSLQPFAQFGDNRSYTFGANGGLESGSTGWTLSGGSVVSGNESYFVHSRSDGNSLSLGSGGNALSPKLCMGTTSTVTRFFVRSGNGGRVRVQVVLKGLLGQVLGIVQISDISPGVSWVQRALASPWRTQSRRNTGGELVGTFSGNNNLIDDTSAITGSNNLTNIPAHLGTLGRRREHGQDTGME